MPSMKSDKIDTFLRKVGRKIGEIRFQKGLTQYQLAEKAGVSIEMVQYWESGRNVTLKTLFNLSKHLGHSIPGLLAEPKGPIARRGRPRMPRKKK